MPLGSSPYGIRDATQPQGFALMVAISLMSLILMLLLSLSVFVKVEVSTNIQSMEVVKARQNALLGLNTALGKLQQLTGQDQRATASAAIFDSISGSGSVVQAHWLGVWDTSEIEDVQAQRNWDLTTQTDKLSKSLGWLVSGPANSLSPTQDPSQGGTVRTILMANPPMGSPVEVAKDAIIDASGQVTGYTAYWVTDQSERARLNLSDPYRTGAGHSRSASLSQRFAPEISLGSGGLDEDTLSTVQDLNDLDILGEDATLAQWDFTTKAASVLANAAQGGLRLDLTPMIRTPSVNLDGGVTVDSAQFPAPFRQDDSSIEESYERYLWVIENISSEVSTGSSLSHPNARSGDLRNAPIYGPRWEALWDYANAARLVSGNTVNMHEPINTDWLSAVLAGSNTVANGLQPALQQVFGPWNSYNQGSEKEGEILTPYEAMALGSQGVPISFSNVFDDARIMPEHHLLNSAMTPIITELVFYVTLSVDPTNTNEPLKLMVHPYMELSNPYDVDIQIDHRYWLPTALLSPVFDIKLINSTNPSNNKTWSVDMSAQVSGNENEKSHYRALGTLLSGARDTLGSNASGEAEMNMQITLSLPAGFTIPAGKTIGYIADTSDSSGNVRMQAGSTWWNYGLEAPVKLWQNGSASGTDSAYNINWPGVPLSNFDQIELTTFLLPYRWEGGKETGIILSSGAGTQWPNGFKNVRLNHQRINTYLPINSLSENSVEDRGDAFYNEVSLFRGATGWNSTDIDLLVWQLRCLSAGDFQSGLNALNQGVDSFLGQSNPRAYLVSDPSGLEGRDASETSGWQFALYPGAAGSFNLQGPGWGKQEGSPDDTFLFHVPDDELLSVGQFRHANIAYGPGDPAYPILGSSRPNGNALPRDETINFKRVDNVNASLNSTDQLDFSGISYTDSVGFWKTDLVVDATFYNNRALLDGYFFSTTPATNPLASKWANSRMKILNLDDSDLTAKLSDSERAASALVLEGGFNVNSTSERAWAAVLASHLGLSPDGFASANPDSLYFARMPTLPSGNDDWSQVRPIDLSDIYQSGQESDPNSRTLSKRIVEEIRKRGPFLTLSHFVNRMLVDDERGEAGALQAAIASSSVNDSESFAHAPGSISQADILESLAPVLVARGDTFTIHVVGEAINPLSKEVTARVRGEATVQRLPEYIEGTDLPETKPADLAITENQTFGRGYRIIDFRWLPADEQS